MEELHVDHNDKINVNLPEGTNELVIRHGEAKEIEYPQTINISGIITSPGDWWQKKSRDVTDSHVIVYDKSISLIIHEHDLFGQEVINGTIQSFKELEKFQINGNKRYSTKELSRFLKFNRMYFLDRDENMEIVSKLQKFRAKVTQEIEDGNDFKGNKKYLFEQKVTHELGLLEFTLYIPIFKGENPVSFKVEIGFDITDGSTTLFLESVELKELEQSIAKQLIEDQIKRFPEDMTIIYV